MKKILTLVAIAIVFASCATIFTKSSYPISFTSSPDDAKITITNRSGRTIYAGNTPATITLKSAAGYMKREEYTITLNREGFEPQTTVLTSNLDGWYIGNILIGGLIGMLIVDPASGAMYRFVDSTVHTELKQSEERGLHIVNIDKVSEDAKIEQVN